MPAVSVAQRKLMAIAEHDPSAVSAKNKGVLNMTHEQLHDFAHVSEHGLPQHIALAHHINMMKKVGTLKTSAMPKYK